MCDASYLVDFIFETMGGAGMGSLVITGLVVFSFSALSTSSPRHIRFLHTLHGLTLKLNDRIMNLEIAQDGKDPKTQVKVIRLR